MKNKLLFLLLTVVLSTAIGCTCNVADGNVYYGCYGTLLPCYNNYYNIGSPTGYWNTIYVNNIVGWTPPAGAGTGNVTAIPGGIVGYVPYFSTSTNLMNSGIIWNVATQRVGINNAIPATALDVTGGIHSTGDIDSNSDINASNDLNCLNDLDVGDNATINDTLDMTAGAIINVLDPVNPQDAATKAYVDSKVTTANITGAGTAGKLARWISAAVLNDATNTDAEVASAVASLQTQSPSVYTKREMQVLKNQGVATIANVGFLAAPALTATASNADDTDGPWVNHATTAVLNNPSGVISLFTILRRDWEPEYITTIKTTAANMTYTRYWIGIFSASPDTIKRGTGNIHIAAFSYDTSTGDEGTPVWRTATSNGAGAWTTSNTTQSIAVNTKYLMRIACSNTTGDIKFYINNVLVSTMNTTMPTSTQLLGYGNRVTCLGAGGIKNIKWGRIAILEN